MAKKIEFPRNLYKGDGPIKWNHGKTYATKYVVDKKEYDEAIKEGFIDDFEEALYGECADYEVVDEEVETEKEEISVDIDDDF